MNESQPSTYTAAALKGLFFGKSLDRVFMQTASDKFRKEFESKRDYHFIPKPQLESECKAMVDKFTECFGDLIADNGESEGRPWAYNPMALKRSEVDANGALVLTVKYTKGAQNEKQIIMDKIVLFGIGTNPPRMWILQSNLDEVTLHRQLTSNI